MKQSRLSICKIPFGYKSHRASHESSQYLDRVLFHWNIVLLNNLKIELKWKENFLIIFKSFKRHLLCSWEEESTSCYARLIVLNDSLSFLFRKEQGSSAYLIEVGGSSYMGMFGYLTAFQEMMMNQVKHNSFFTHV